MTIFYVFVEEFQSVLQHAEPNKFVPFNFDCEFIKLHFGEKKDRYINYNEFTQVMWVRLPVATVIPLCLVVTGYFWN